MNEKLSKAVQTAKCFLTKHSPEILTGIGVTGMIATTVMAVKATPRVLYLIEEAETVKGERLTAKETVKAAWKPYIPAVITGTLSVACIVGASTVNTKRNAALATAYALSEKTLLTYKDKVIETIGENKEKSIREHIAQDEVTNKPVSTSQVIITPKGNTLCMDSISGRYFRTDLDKIRKTVNELNRQMTQQNYISLFELYIELGLDPIKNSERLGWNIDDGLIEIEFNTTLAENDEPCVVIDYARLPKYNFDMMG